MKVKGFTLIELIIVFSILAIVSAIAVPIYRHHVNNAQKLQAISGSAEVYTSFMWYYRENIYNLNTSMVASHIRKVSGSEVYSVDIKEGSELKISIKYEYENLKYVIEIYPDASIYKVMDDKYNLLYLNE